MEKLKIWKKVKILLKILKNNLLMYSIRNEKK